MEVTEGKLAPRAGDDEAPGRAAGCGPRAGALPFSMPVPQLRALVPLALLAGLGAFVTACGRSDASAQPSVAGERAAVTRAAQPLSDTALARRADRGRILGPDSAMWVVMISDFQCPFCKQWHEQSMAEFERDFITTGKVRFAYLHLPLTSIHPHAQAQAEASMCAGVQGKFWPFADALFRSQAVVKGMSSATPLFTRFATQLGLDRAAFEQCLGSPVIKQLVANDIAQANTAGVQSTPTFLIGDFLVQGALPYPTFRKAVDSALVVARAKRGR